MIKNLFQLGQVIVACGLINVWILRFNRQTEYRGGSALNMKEEFANYGLPEWSVYAIGFLKLTCAIGFILGLWFTELIKPAAGVLGILMTTAVLMHFKVRDHIKKSIPAIVMLVLSIFLLFGPQAKY